MQRNNLRTHLRRRKSLKPGFLSLIALAAVGGYAVVLLLVSLLSFITSKAAPDNTVISVFTSLALFVGAYTGGYISAKHRHKNGLLMGLCCGLFMFLVILVIGLFISGKSEGFGAPAKFFITIIASGIGGVAGVNSTTFR